MLKKYLWLALIVTFINLSCGGFVFGATEQVKDAKRTAKVKAKILKSGSDESKKIVVALKGGGKIKGYISKVTADSFEVTNKKTNAATSIAYRDVKRFVITDRYQGIRIASGLAIGALAIALFYVASGE